MLVKLCYDYHNFNSINSCFVSNLFYSPTLPTVRWRYARLGAVFAILVIIIIAVIGLAFFIPATSTSIVIPNTTSSHPIFQAQSSPLVVLLTDFTGENYSSYAIASNINGPSTSNISSRIWVAQAIHHISNSYTSGSIILPDSYDIHFYALHGSTFNITFSSLFGSNGSYALVELREFLGSGLNGSVIESMSVQPSPDSQLVTLTLNKTGFVAIRITSKGVSGNFDYDIMINTISLEQSLYICTIDSINTCQGTSVYENNYILIQTTPESDSIYPIVMVTLFGKKKPGLLNLNLFIPGVVLIVFVFIICAATLLAVSVKYGCK